MSIYAIQQYHRELEERIHFGGTSKETAIRHAFQKLLDVYAIPQNLLLVAEVSIKLKNGRTVTPDGTLKDQLRLDHGYWESKDESDDIEEEIKKKFAKGYPSDNIVFEDSHTAVLFQHGAEVMRVDMQDEAALDKLLTRFVSFERQEIKDFRTAIEKFKQDIPKVTEAIREIIERQHDNAEYNKAVHAFHELCRQSINPDVSNSDVQEMIVQHILSADIFNTIFDEPHFHQENNIARELNKVVDTFFTGAARRQTLGSIKHYYDTINANAAGIADHHEKQKFLKVVYENFYKGYNPKAADRLGIVYTPNEIVQFMIKSTDWLLHTHFNKSLGNKNVEILDPATGTGTFICDIIDYLSKKDLLYKYKHELHANEIAILPYYIANLNIEYTYKQKMGSYEEFENLCFVDTLDNTGFNWIGKQGDLFGVSAENAARIKKQNQKRISVVIGNPPYNANQQNENDNNKNRAYKEIDKRIKDTFIKNSTAQKTKLYDMYSRFYRWAMDRLNDNGIIAFVTNRSFIDSRTFDGFRKSIQDDFDFAYIIDTKSDVRANPKLSGSIHNVFGIQAGVAVLFLVRSSSGLLKPHKCKIQYVAMDDFWRKEQKLQWFQEHPIDKVDFENVVPDKNNNWINLNENNWEKLIPVCEKGNDDTIFNFSSNGIATNRDEWVYDFSMNSLIAKVIYFINEYNKLIMDNDSSFPNKIKWSETLKGLYKTKKKLEFNTENIIEATYRPFIKLKYYGDKILSDRLTENHFEIFGKRLNSANSAIWFKCGVEWDFFALGINHVFDILPQGGSKCLPLYCYNSTGSRNDNITDWALRQFWEYYHGTGEKMNEFIRQYEITKFGTYSKGGVGLEFPSIRKKDIFHYVYAVLHHPVYRTKYALNLKREFPRIPFYENFTQWAEWGTQLMDLHINYETVAPYQLDIVKVNTGTAITDIEKLQKAKLKADKINGIIELDTTTSLTGIPAAAWEYKLGNRSALEWILDQYKEKKPSDPTIAEKFNTYRFADYKEQVIDLLKRVCTVSVETMKIIGEMPEE